MKKTMAGLCLIAAVTGAMAQSKDPARARLEAEITAADARLFGGLNDRDIAPMKEGFSPRHAGDRRDFPGRPGPCHAYREAPLLQQAVGNGARGMQRVSLLDGVGTRRRAVEAAAGAQLRSLSNIASNRYHFHFI
jgi:hypothetical protein